MKTRINDIAALAGISQSYASEIAAGKKQPSLSIALRIYDATGLQYGPLAGRGVGEINTLRAADALLGSAR